jgi:hypothetical protein
VFEDVGLLASFLLSFCVNEGTFSVAADVFFDLLLFVFNSIIIVPFALHHIVHCGELSMGVW